MRPLTRRLAALEAGATRGQQEQEARAAIEGMTTDELTAYLLSDSPPDGMLEPHEAALVYME